MFSSMVPICMHLVNSFAKIECFHETLRLQPDPPVEDILPPTNVHLTPLPLLRGVFLSWEPGETYYGLPYPNISFYLQIHNVVNGSEATRNIEVVGKVWWYTYCVYHCYHQCYDIVHHILSRQTWHCETSSTTTTIQCRWAYITIHKYTWGAAELLMHL